MGDRPKSKNPYRYNRLEKKTPDGVSLLNIILFFAYSLDITRNHGGTHSLQPRDYFMEGPSKGANLNPANIHSGVKVTIFSRCK